MGQADAGNAELLVSTEVLAEMRDVLKRPVIQKKFRTLTPQRIADSVTRIERIGVLIDPVQEAFALTRDQKTRFASTSR